QRPHRRDRSRKVAAHRLARAAARRAQLLGDDPGRGGQDDRRGGVSSAGRGGGGGRGARRGGRAGGGRGGAHRQARSRGERAGARLDPAEEEKLRGERSILANARELAEAAGGAFSLVEDDESSALAQLGRAAHLVQPLAREIADVGQIASELQDAMYRLQETA